MLVIDDMRMVKKVRVAVAYKLYPDGRITAKIRCNYGSPIAHKLAEHFGGGGHSYAAGFKTKDYSSDVELHKAVTKICTELIIDLGA